MRAICVRAKYRAGRELAIGVYQLVTLLMEGVTLAASAYIIGTAPDALTLVSTFVSALLITQVDHVLATVLRLKDPGEGGGKTVVVHYARF
jgi:hypothetical protein